MMRYLTIKEEKLLTIIANSKSSIKLIDWRMWIDFGVYSCHICDQRIKGTNLDKHGLAHLEQFKLKSFI